MSDSTQETKHSHSLKKHNTDPADYKGMGDFSRYRTMKDRGFKSLENSLKDWIENAFQSITVSQPD